MCVKIPHIPKSLNFPYRILRGVIDLFQRGESSDAESGNPVSRISYRQSSNLVFFF